MGGYLPGHSSTNQDFAFWVTLALTCLAFLFIALIRRWGQLKGSGTLRIIFNDYRFDRFAVIRLYQLIWALLQPVFLATSTVAMLWFVYIWADVTAPANGGPGVVAARGFGIAMPYLATSGVSFLAILLIRILMEDFILFTRLAEEGLTRLIAIRRLEE